MSHPDYKHIGTPMDRLAEEIGELMTELGTTLHAMGKARRFGLDGFHPDVPEVSNRDTLLTALGKVIPEMGDVHSAITALQIELLEQKASGNFDLPTPCPGEVLGGPTFRQVYLTDEQGMIDLFCGNQKEKHYFVPLDGLVYGALGFRDTDGGIDYVVPYHCVRERRMGLTFSTMLATRAGREELASACSTGEAVQIIRPTLP